MDTSLHTPPPTVLDDARLQALHDLGVLDTPRERDFDDLTRLVATLCDAPVALVSLVDRDRQWFKSRVGLEQEQTILRESICAHALAQTGILEVPDTRRDPRTVDNPLCQGPEGFRFYAGAPLVLRGGQVIGTLCVLDRQPRALTAQQGEALRVLAGQVVAQLELRRAVTIGETLRREVDHRVTNSLNSLIALVRVDAAGSDDAAVVQALGLFEQRVRAVSTVHEQLYRSGATATVALDRYLASLADAFEGMVPGNVRIDAAFCPAQIRSNLAAALGLLASEIVSNAVKHAFRDGAPGTITLRTDRPGPGLLRFTGEDDGGGASDAGHAQDRGQARERDQGSGPDGRPDGGPDGGPDGRPDGGPHGGPHGGLNGGLGMKISRAIAAQLGGELRVEHGHAGLSVSLTFPCAD